MGFELALQNSLDRTSPVFNHVSYRGHLSASGIGIGIDIGGIGLSLGIGSVIGYQLVPAFNFVKKSSLSDRKKFSQ
jgi:hypothetical protein